MGLASRDVGGDPAEEVARIAAARRGRLLRVHRRRLRWEDLEDCYSQATLELVTRSRRTPFVSYQHILNSLEQKFLSRIEDRRRAIGGRSAIETAIARAVPVDSPDHGASELEDRGAGVEHQVIARIELQRLREVIADLSRDQQLVLASQVYVDMGAGEFCSRHGWSVEKYRKVAQRARGKLRALIEEYERGERCRRLEPDLLAMCAGVAEDEALTRARVHVGNCPTCARMVGELDRAARSVAALLPIPGPVVLGGGGVAMKLAAVWTAVRRAATIVRHPLAETGMSSGPGVAGGSLAGVGALKVGIAAVCVAGAAGGYAVCARLGVLPAIGIGLGHQMAHQAAHHPRRAARRRDGAAPPPAAHARVPSVVVASAGRAGHGQLPVRVSAIAQIRREFGSPPARTASATSLGGGGATSSTSGGPAPVPVVSKAQTSQTQSEFGFEK